MKRPTFLFLVLAAVAAMSQPAAAQYTCESVAVRGETDPDGSFFSNRFRNESAINSAGDALFISRPLGEKDHLYLYENGGASSVVAEGSAPAPLPGATFTARPFNYPSLNDAGDLAFWGRMVSQGEGVFVRASGGALSVAARTSEAAPGGGVFDTFPRVAETNATGTVAFLATTLGGPPEAVYTYDIPGGGPATSAVSVGDVTTSGREICNIATLDYADGGHIALLGETKVSCASVVEVPIDTIMHVSGATITEVAKIGDPTPIGGTTYARFKLAPHTNSTGEVLFHTKLTGVISSEAVFLWNGIIANTVVVQGDFSPEAGGSYRKFSDIGLANGSKVFVKAKFKGGPTKEAIIRFDGALSTSVMTKSDAPPVPPYALGAFYRKLGKFIAVSHDGVSVGFVPKVKDSVIPKSKVGVIRCGSASGAFLDGETFF